MCRPFHPSFLYFFNSTVEIIFLTIYFRPIPDREYVDAYIKAYYLPDAQLEMWIREHKVGTNYFSLLFNGEVESCPE